MKNHPEKQNCIKGHQFKGLPLVSRSKGHDEKSPSCLREGISGTGFLNVHVYFISLIARIPSLSVAPLTSIFQAFDSKQKLTQKNVPELRNNIGTKRKHY